MAEESMEDRMDRVRRNESERQAGHKASRQEFLRRLLGGKDALAWQVPPQIEDFDALLLQHAAQLNNAVRYTMEFALCDGIGVSEHTMVIGSLTRMIQTNIAIAKAMTGEKSKTVRGGPARKYPQD